MKILWVKAGGLLPLDSGGKIRSYHILRELSRRHEVSIFTFYAEHPNDIHAELDRICARVIRHPLHLPRTKSLGNLAHYARHIVSSQPYQVVKYCTSQVTVSLGRLLQTERFDIIICDFLVAAGIIPWDFPCPKVLFTHNVEAQIWKRHFQVTRNPIWKAISWREFRKTFRAEIRYLNLADHVLTVSGADRDSFAQLVDPAKITVIPTGVDVDYFRPTVAAEHSNALVFTGSMNWMPNEDAIFYFVKKILPSIQRQFPNVSLAVVGRDPSVRLLDLARTTNGVTVTGRVEDIRPYLQNGSVYIVPLRVGSGTRLKIFESMAMGKAVVSTSIGAEGLPIHRGRDIIIADTPEEFASAVIGLLKDGRRRSQLGRMARELVVREHNWDSVGRHFESVLETLVKSKRGNLREQPSLGVASPFFSREEKEERV